MLGLAQASVLAEQLKHALLSPTLGGSVKVGCIKAEN
jgi:hypothetical protein